MNASFHDLSETEIRTYRERVDRVFPQIEDDLRALVRIPSISSSSPEEVRRSAEAVAELLRGAGVASVEILHASCADGTPGAPAVVASIPAPAGAPTVLLYAHHDVQPVGNPNLWNQPPFEPTLVGERLYGRGAADDKAGIVAHLGALRVLGDDLGVGVTLFIEGEEEIGSPSFVDFLTTYRDRLGADVIIVADSSNWRVGVPGLTTSLRGLVDLDVEVRVLEHAIHSGMFGGPIIDAVTVMSKLIATLHDDMGDVAVAGLVSKDASDLEYPEADFRQDSGAVVGLELAGTGSLTTRLWTKPAVSVIGMDITAVDESSNTIIPSVRARISLRIAPGQDPAEAMRALREHLEANVSFGAQVNVTELDMGQAFESPADSAAMRAARWAFEAAWGVPPADMGLGGSIPFIADLVNVFPNAAVLVTGVEDPSSRAHAEDESVHLGELAKVIHAEAMLLACLAPKP